MSELAFGQQATLLDSTSAMRAMRRLKPDPVPDRRMGSPGRSE